MKGKAVEDLIMANEKLKKRKSPVAVPSNHLLGSDIYEGDIIDWGKLKGQLFFLIMRAHYGKVVDTEFANYWSRAQGIGLRRGAYGFLRPAEPLAEQIDAAAQAVKAIGGFKIGDMGFYGDAENAPAWIAAMPEESKRMDFLLAYLSGVEEKTGSKPGLYASPGFLAQVFTDLTPLSEYGLWIAHWKTKVPAVPAAWRKKKPPYELWQDLGDAWSCPGINGGKKNKADRDLFPGTEADFNARFGTPV